MIRRSKRIENQRKNVDFDGNPIGVRKKPSSAIQNPVVSTEVVGITRVRDGKILDLNNPDLRANEHHKSDQIQQSNGKCRKICSCKAAALFSVGIALTTVCFLYAKVIGQK